MLVEFVCVLFDYNILAQNRLMFNFAVYSHFVNGIPYRLFLFVIIIDLPFEQVAEKTSNFSVFHRSTGKTLFLFAHIPPSLVMLFRATYGMVERNRR